ncbi:MAG: hypothetical protein FJY73_08905 [Candidatus Eisenbacteria bacterium]|nr:hypothetical protein [Candidatus Eisenbacteria bacterium]
MSTFIIRLVHSADEPLRGRVRHVGTGEEATFSSADELLSFMEGIAVLDGLGAESEEEGEGE